MEEFCGLREEWFRKWLTLPNGIPCPNTFSRVMEALDPVEFSLCIHAHLQQTGSLISAKQIAIDGKALRGSRSLGVNHIHAVSAWVCESGLTLAQAFVTEKSNEITAIPELLKMLNLKGAVVTLDAMGTQREIAEQIVEGKGDYLLFVKDNQKNLHREISDHFEFASRQLGVDKLSSESWSHSLSEGKSHGRKERRQTIVCHQLDWMDHEIRSAWKGLGCIIMVVRRSEMGDGRIRSQTSYYMSSLTRKQLRATHDEAQLEEILSLV